MKIRMVIKVFMMIVSIIISCIVFFSLFHVLSKKYLGDNRETFIRYEITRFSQASDYINDATVEKSVFAYETNGSYLYIYGISGYTKVNLGLNAKVIKIMNVEYYNNISDDSVDRFTINAKLPFLKEKYGDKLIFKKDFNDISISDIKIFFKLKNEGSILLERMKKDDVSEPYVNKNKELSGLSKLNDDLDLIYRNR